MIEKNTLTEWNKTLSTKTPSEIIIWALNQANGHAIVSTNFRPYEVVLLDLVTKIDNQIPVLWVDHGYNRHATYRYAEDLRKRLNLNIKAFLPRISAAHRDAIYGPLPSLDDENALKVFSAQMKLEPFHRGMRELAPKVWITALRKSQNTNRATLDIVSYDTNFNTIKVNPLLNQDDSELEQYLAEHNLPNEWDYFDPAKADEKRECGLHASWGNKAVELTEKNA
jgi:phosphoadenosine phosphosulfate reductase